MSLCTYCGQTGHTAQRCPRRARAVTLAVAEAQWIMVTKPPKPIVAKRKSRKVDPKRFAAWVADLEAINREMASCSTSQSHSGR